MIHAEISLMPNSLDNGEMLHDEFQLNLTEKVNGNWLATLINKALREYNKAQDKAIAMIELTKYVSARDYCESNCITEEDLGIDGECDTDEVEDIAREYLEVQGIDWQNSSQ